MESLGPLGRAERAQAVQRGPFKPGFTTHCCVTSGKFLNKSEPQFPCVYNLYNKGTPPVASAGGFIEVPRRSWAHMAADACVTPSSYDTNPRLSRTFASSCSLENTGTRAKARRPEGNPGPSSPGWP